MSVVTADSYGAVPVLTPDDILDYYGVKTSDGSRNVNETEQKILAFLGGKTMHMDEISAGLSLPMTQLLKWHVVLQKKRIVIEARQKFLYEKNINIA